MGFQDKIVGDDRLLTKKSGDDQRVWRCSKNLRNPKGFGNLRSPGHSFHIGPRGGEDLLNSDFLLLHGYLLYLDFLYFA